MSDPGKTGVVLVSLLDLGANTGGPRRTRQLARLLAAAGARAHLIGYRAPGMDERAIAAPLAADGVTTTLLARDAAGWPHRLRYSLGLPWSPAERAALLREIRAALAAGRARALVLYNQDAIAARVIAALCREAGVAFVQQYAEAHVAADFPLGALNARWWNERQHLRSTPRFSDGSIVISTWLEATVAAAGGGETILLPSFVDVAEWDSAGAAARPEGDPHLMYVGDGARRDCVPLIREAVELVRTRGSRCRLSLVGVPRVPPAELAAHYRTADAFILLRTDDRSSRACLPTRLGELLLTGRPVIVSDLPDYNRYLRDRDNGYVVNGPGAAAVADAIQAALARTPENDAIGGRGRATALAQLDWRAQRDATAAWLARVTARQN
jgi:hypothetical protein